MSIEVELPDGSIAEFPDGTSPDVMKQALGRHKTTSLDQAVEGAGRFAANVPSGTKPPEVDTFADTVKSLGSGAVQGVTGLVGLPGTVEQLGRMGINYAAKTFGGATDNVVSPQPALATGQDVKTMVENNITGKLHEPQSTAGKYAKTIGEFAPGALFPGGLAQRVIGNVVAPAVASEAAGQATEGTSLEPWARVGGALAGGMAPNMIGRALTPAPSNAVRQGHVNTLRNEGVTDLTAGQVTGAMPLRWMEAATLDTPMTGARLPTMMERQAEQFTQAALRRAGINAPRATQDVIDQGFTQLGQRFDALANASTARMTTADANRITTALRNYERLTPPRNQVDAVREYLQNLVTHAGNPIPGPVYARYRSQIEKDARALQVSDPMAAETLRNIRNVLDDAVERGMPQAQRGQWRETRNQYRNLLVVSKAAGAAGEGAANGLISPAQLAGATKQLHGLRNYQRGRGDYAQLARAGEAIMKPLPQSGTAPRLMAMQLGQTVAGGAAGAAAGGGDPTTTTIGALLPWIIRGAAGRALMSRPAQRYLTNQAFPNGLTNAAQSSRVGGALATPEAMQSLMDFPR